MAADRLDELGHLLVEVGVGGVGADLVEVGGDGADVPGDGPLVVVEHDDEALGGLSHVVEGLETDTAGEGGVAGDDDDVFVRAAQVAGGGHAEACGQGGAGVARAVAVMLALGAEEEAVEAAVLADAVDLPAAPGEHFVHVALMADVEEDFVRRRIEGAVQGDGQFDHAEVGAAVSARLGHGMDEFLADFPGEEWEVLFRDGAHVGGAVDPGKDGLFIPLRGH